MPTSADDQEPRPNPSATESSEPATGARFDLSRFRLDRRHFLMGSSALVLAGSVDRCTPEVPGPPGAKAGDARVADTVLAPPGSPGLVDEAYWNARVEDFLSVATANPSSSNVVGVGARLLRATRDPGYVWNIHEVTPATFASVWDKIDSWADTRDFDLMYLHWLLELGQGSTEMTRLHPDVIDAIRQRMVNNRYRYDDPLPADRLDQEWFWSENHRIIGHANEYLAGQRFPDDIFTVTGMTGTESRDRTKPEILGWISERVDFGFFEWHSNVYMLKDVVPLLMLVEQADDPEVVAAAAIALDMCVLDQAAHLQNGCYTAPRGRTYEKDKMNSLDEDTFGTTKFLFDDTSAGYPALNDSGATYFSAAQRYRPPQVMLDIATSDQTHVVRERHGVYFDGSRPIQSYVWAPYGRDFTNKENLPFWWSLGAVGMWPMAQVGVAEANKFRLWDTEGFEQIRLLALLNDFDPVKIRDWMQPRSAVINFGFLSEANTYAWRHPRVSLASVLDHRKGEMRDQAHAWQAAIDERAMVFTTHPVTEPADTIEWSRANAPAYWTGTGSMPRSAQHERTAVHLYDPVWDASTDPLVWAVLGYRDYTHAYFPKDHFDRVVQSGHWTIGERAGGYIALWSWRPPTWRDHPDAVYQARGFTSSFDLVAHGGADNVWIVECGAADLDGSLDDFAAALSAQDPVVTKGPEGFTVQWDSPAAGAIGFGWNDPFTVNGAEVPLGGFPRHESPWGRIERESQVYQLSSGAASWRCDFRTRTRQVS